MRKILFLGLIALGFSLPILMSTTENRPEPWQSTPTGRMPMPMTGNGAPPVTPPPVVISANDQSAVGPGASPWQFASSGGAGPPMVQSQPPVYHAFLNPAEFLNFRITPDWVRSRWSRVSITRGEDELTGMRVALVSGPRPADLCGSLTYWFDNSRQLQRISFRGWTGEPSELTAMLTSHYRFSPRESSAAGYYEITSWGRLRGFLRMDYPAVLRSDAPNEQLTILMEIVNPESSLTVSRQSLGTLAALGR